MKQSKVIGVFPNGNGYLICRLKNDKVIPLHKYIFQQVNGKVPKGCEIHHDNGNILDNTPENLLCVTVAEHGLHHTKKSNKERKHLYNTIQQMRYHLLRITNPKRLREILLKYQQDYDLSDYINSLSCTC